MERMIGRDTSVNVRAPRRRAARACTRGVTRLLTNALLVTAALSGSARAQAGLTHTDDAAPVPRGVARLRVVPSWARFDSRFDPARGSTATAPLAAALSADSLGVAQIPALAPAQDAVRTLTGDPTFRLSLGRSVSRATARVATTAFVGEYGLTRRLTLRAVLPIVQTQTDIFVALNPEGGDDANVGPNPVRIPSSMQRQQAINLQTQIGSARTTLQSRLEACEANPSSDPSCATILANRADVQTLISDASAFNSALALLYGTATNAATHPFVPLADTPAEDAIAARLAALKERFRSYVGSTADQIVATVPLAVGPAGFGDLRELFLGEEFGMSPDSLGTVYRINVGDVEVGAKLVAFQSGAWADAPSTPAVGVRSSWLRTRVSVLGVVRFGTGSATIPRIPYAFRYLEYGTGDGQTDLEGSVLADVALGSRIVLLAAARYTAQLGQVAAGRIPDENGVVNPFLPLFDGSRRLGDMFAAEVTPRFILGRYLAADLHYALLTHADDEFIPADGTTPLLRAGFTEQRVGVALSYSTLRGARGRVPRLPVEATLSHIQTISGSSGQVVRAARDQIELRLYYRIRRG